MSGHVSVPREDEILISVVGLLVRAHPVDRLRLAQDFRSDAVRAGEGMALPEPPVLVWLTQLLEQMLARLSGCLPAVQSGDHEEVAA